MKRIQISILALLVLFLLLPACSMKEHDPAEEPSNPTESGLPTEPGLPTEALTPTEALPTPTPTEALPTPTEALPTPTSALINETEDSYMQNFKHSISELVPSAYETVQSDVTYGTIQKETYFSQTAERETPVNVLLPPNYSEDKEYPVLYILHGFYDNQDWMTRPVVKLATIYGNLLAKGEAEEMIIVMPYIFCDKELPTCTGMDLKNCEAYDNFINDLTTDLMPFIEKTFSVATGRENTAITGFSMGGRESLFIGFQHPELFGYIGAVCPAPGLVKIPGSGMHPGQMTDQEMVFPDEKPFVVLISSSKKDGVVSTSPDSYRNTLKENGEAFLSHVMNTTGHDHSSVKPHLYNYLRMLFK